MQTRNSVLFILIVVSLFSCEPDPINPPPPPPGPLTDTPFKIYPMAQMPAKN